MGVDGIGSGGGRPVGGVGTAQAAAPASPSPADEASAAGSAREIQSHALSALERGEIDLDGYLGTRVDLATRHLEARLPEADLVALRETLREQLTTDPVLVELVRRTTGELPKPRTE